MTPKKQFISKFTALMQHHQINAITALAESALNNICIAFENPQDDEILSDNIKRIGLDNEGNFFIEVENDNYGRIYEYDLDHNGDDVWDALWTCVSSLSDVDVCHSFKNGDKVHWVDPGLNDYEPAYREWAKRRVFTVIDVSNHDEDGIITISNGRTDAEVFSNELIPINPNNVIYTITLTFNNDGNIETETRLASDENKAIAIRNEILKTCLNDRLDKWQNENGTFNVDAIEDDGWEFYNHGSEITFCHPGHYITIMITICETIIE